MIPVFDAVFYCHGMGIIHRDLKPDNLLVSLKDLDQAVIKISDFGLARKVNPHDLATTVCGTPTHVAPEIINQQPYDEGCDIWSLGIILYWMCSGKHPFYHEEKFELFKLIKEGKFTFDLPVFEKISDELKDLICSLLVVNPNHRITKDGIL
jgi:serine/threonine protein kinase